MRVAVVRSFAPGGTLRNEVLSPTVTVTASPWSVLREICRDWASSAVTSPITWPDCDWPRALAASIVVASATAANIPTA